MADKPMWSDDKNVVAVRRKLKKRAHKGIRKYGTTTMREDVDLRGWLQHLQEELMDATVYIEAALKSLDKEKRPATAAEFESAIRQTRRGMMDLSDAGQVVHKVFPRFRAP